ncbi:testis expressed 11 [Plakobranchus ocellatus]|uniref:Testis expressed 11 n=1 Tax=Plakobranchus ocellatus TaxID=259542 RepID=A0AAV4ADE8_9GAST|nr:testis expressed 11 [Plakobranchus ocellatus]
MTCYSLGLASDKLTHVCLVVGDAILPFWVCDGFLINHSQKKILTVCPYNEANFHRHQNCLIMSCAACLQLSRQSQSEHHVQDLLEEVLQHIEEYREAEQRAVNTLGSLGTGKSSASTEMFLLLYEFESLSKLKDARAETIFDKALMLPNPTPKFFHTLSVLAIDAPANNRKLSMRALKVAIKLHLQTEQPDFVKCSADVRNLISMSLMSNDQEAKAYFEETLDIIEKIAKDKYPEVELLWLMTKSWNWGIQYYNSDKPVEAEKWCSVSMSFLKYLPVSREEYQDQMMSIYGEILNCIETEAKQRAMEE